MLKTIKSRIIVFTLIILFILSGASIFLLKLSYEHNKELEIRALGFAISYYSEVLNKRIGQFEENVVDMTIMGETFYYSGSDRKKSTLEALLYENFKKDQTSQGGGIFFEPYVVKKNQKFFSSYAYESDNGVLIDNGFNNEVHSYFKKSWYKELKEEFAKGKMVAWSTPYVDDVGTKSLMITAGSPLYTYKHELLGIATTDWVLDDIIIFLKAIKPGENSFIVFADLTHDFIIAVDKNGIDGKSYIGKPLSSVEWYNSSLKNEDEFIYQDTAYIFFDKKLENNMILIMGVPRNEFLREINHRTNYMILMLIFSCLFLTLIIYIALYVYVNKPIDYMKRKAEEIGKGSLNVKMEIKSPKEFADLSSSFNQMTDNLKDYISKAEKANYEKEQIETELKIAKTIQESSLPNVFPPYPERCEFDIYAFMETAHDVGGDFYDFFFIDEFHFVFLIADISGKGAPAALFMMSTKTMMENISHAGYSVDKIINTLNQEICKNNKQGLFVTIFCGILDTRDGIISYVNAGHNPPIIKTQKETYYLEAESNVILGAFDDVMYKKGEIKLNKDDAIILYTDGMTEATNSDKEFYGEEKLLASVKNADFKNNLKRASFEVKNKLKSFTRESEVADDITFLALKYLGNDTKRRKLILPPDIKYLNVLLNSFETILLRNRTEKSITEKVNIVIDEIFSNIVKYAQLKEEDDIISELKVGKNEIILTFTDSGIPYDPLKHEDADIDLPLEERELGGLGILMVKNMSDEIRYKREDDRNILQIKFRIP